MTEQTVLVKLPGEIYERIREDAEQGHVSVGDALSDVAALFFAPVVELNSVLAVMEDYTDKQLWRVVNMRLTKAQEARLEVLTGRSKSGSLSDEEKAKLDTLTELIEHQMVLRSQALLLLKQRGYEQAVENYLKSGKVKLIP